MSAHAGIRTVNERGVALVMAIVVLLVISLLATTLMQNLSTQRKISGHGLRTSRALSAAEAGVAEMISRMRSGEIELDESTAAAAAQIYLATGGLVPAVGADTAAYATVQASGEWLDYSSATSGPDVLTLGFRTDEAGDILRWDDDQSPALNTACGMPVFCITSTGKIHGDRTRIRTEFVWKPRHVMLNAALCAATDVTLEGDVSLCGYQHQAATNFEDAALGRTGSPSCVHHEVGRGNLPGVWSGGVLSNNGAQVTGIPVPAIEGQSGFYDGPWEPLGLTSHEFADLMPAPTKGLTELQGFGRIDDDETIGNAGQTYAIDGLRGEGVLYVDGDLTLSGVIEFRGMIYVNGDFVSTATGTVVGGVVVAGGTDRVCSLTNGPAIVYSRDAINEAIGRASREIVTLSWREVR